MYSSESNTSDCIQVAYPLLSNKIYIRKCSEHGIWTDWKTFSDDATVIESAIESAIKNYQIQSQEADSPFNIPLEIGAYIVSLSQYGSWENTTAMYIVFLSTDPQTSYIEKITSHALLDALDIQMGDDHQSIDVYNTAAATMKVSAFKVGGLS